ncbi:hypothetical protein HDV03_002749 [Kappamyces sp. JEL0829]|nr:hypothetical protein HDV03_002749 [Kappamyces sp. JEL0829]
MTNHSAVFITKAGAASVLKVQEVATPSPGPDEVLIQVKAAGINFADLAARQGLYPDAPPLPCVVGYEVSGIVLETGSSVDASWKGREVVAFTRFGGYSEVVATPFFCAKPKELSWEDAASIPVVFCTAWILMYEMGGLRKGQTVLIQNAGGGVGLAAIDIAKHIGAVSIGTASGRKHQFLNDWGLDHAIDYNKEDVTERVMKLTKNMGVDLIIDPIGGPNWSKNYAMLRATGRLGVFGASDLQNTIGSASIVGKVWGLLRMFFGMPRWTPLSLMDVNKGVFGVNLGHMWHEKEKIIHYLDFFMKNAVGEEAWVRPRVDAVFSFDQAAQAHEYIEARKNTGKVILVPSQQQADAWNKTKNP